MHVYVVVESQLSTFEGGCDSSLCTSVEVTADVEGTSFRIAL
jgi:hypothetical protein